MSADRPKPTQEFFEVDSALLSEIGEKLVTTPHVALAELVKNAYDADATEVHVAIAYDQRRMPTVEVRDNGHGMTLEAVRRYWMRIGTTNKQENELSPRYGRRRTGAKGIGRFACRRLGNVLELDTCAELSKKEKSANEKFEKTSLVFHWNEFVAGSEVSSVPVEAQTERLAKVGTNLCLKISTAKADEWSFRGYAYLKRQLAALCANQGTRRKGFEEDPGFRVYLKAPGFEFINEVTDLREELVNAGWGTLTAKIDDEGHARCTLVAKGIGKRTVRSSKPFKNLTDVSLRLAIFPIEREWLRDTNVVSQTSVGELCESWGGVQVRFRGFRIYPYGDEEDDWLNIERDRARRLGRPSEDDIFDYASTLDGVDASRSLLNMLSMKNYFGSVDIGSKQDGLEPKADRMGFVETDVFRELKRFARFAIDWAMVVRDYAIELDSTHQRNELRERLIKVHGQKLSERDSPEEVIRVMRTAVREVAGHAPAKSQPAIELLQDASALLESTLSITSRDLSRLRLVASASTLTLLFAHEIKSLTSTFAAISKFVSRTARDFPAEKRKVLEHLGAEIDESHKSLSELIELTNVMGVLDRKAQPVHLDLRDALQRATARFERVRQRYEITIDTKDVPEGLQVGPMLEGELLAVLINVLSNSIKAVIAGGGKRLISFDAEHVGKHTRLNIRDTGIGVPEEYFVDVFTPMISDPAGTLYDKLEARLNPEDSFLLGGGTGLGLSIVRGILQVRHGNVELMHPSEDWKFHLRLDLP
jgi:signal transduction histidine kinase